MEYRTPAERCEASFTEKKSEFIGYLAPVSTEEEAIAFVNEIRAMHRKATHNCYAYILRENNTARHSDDGEPSGTAGVPMYDVLRKEGLTDVACVVTRYFGGILLGAGGLVRAYSKGVSMAVSAAKIKQMALADELVITVAYTLYGKAASIIAEAETVTVDESFTDNVTLTLYIRTEQKAALCDKLTDACCGNVEIKTAQTRYYDFGQK